MLEIIKSMNNTTKNTIYSIALVLLISVVYFYRKSNTPAYIYITGQTMGTVTYNIKYSDKEGRNFKSQIDSLLIAFNQSQSTYIPTSEISRFNQGDSLQFESPYFYPVLKRSKEIYIASGGKFNPTVMPLVNAWGFGPAKKDSLDAKLIDSLLTLVDFESIVFDERGVRKNKKGVCLDFSAIAKGYASDVLADFLISKGVQNLMVEIGGEVVCRGLNDKGTNWSIGIEDPNVALNEQRVFQKIYLKNMAMATSGNYRNFYENNGKKYWHTIDPHTGYPAENTMLSSSVIASDCMTADAYATAFMAMGIEKAKELLAHHTEINAFLIYTENGEIKTYYTPQFQRYFKEE
jgi:thiamine biosynthesis lipoprotein